MYNILTTDITCPNCGDKYMIREEPRIIKSNTETYTYTCPCCGFMHMAKSDEDMKEWIKSLGIGKPIKEEILIEKEETDYHAMYKPLKDTIEQICKYADEYKVDIDIRIDSDGEVSVSVCPTYRDNDKSNTQQEERSKQ